MQDGLGARCRQCRKALGLRISDVALVLGQQRQTVYRTEWGTRDPTLGELRVLASLFRTKPAWLVFGEGKPPAYLKQGEEGAVCQAG